MKNLRQQAHSKITAQVEAAAENATKVIVLEIWSGQDRCMSVRWGKSQPFRQLLRALAVVWMKPGSHFVLMTTAHQLAGHGCVKATDTPNSLALPRGGTLIMHHLLHPPDTSPAFLPPLTVAWNILKNRGVHVWEKTLTRRRYDMRVRDRVSRWGSMAQ